VDEAPAQVYSLVIIGKHPLPDVVEPRGPDVANMSKTGFMPYRQVELINFLMGNRQFRYPTAREVDTALDRAEGGPVWPAADSVRVLDGVAIVSLQAVTPGVETTRPFAGE